MFPISPDDFDWQDWYCGAGGSTTGIIGAAGDASTKLAVNHWQRAIDVHSANHEQVDHYRTDLALATFRGWPRTFGLWASPECTNHSLAKGRSREAQDASLFDQDKMDAEDRSRATMFDVLRGAEQLAFEVMIVENVPDVCRWSMFPGWLLALDGLGYTATICSINSMICHPTPQSRDRIYIVCQRKRAGMPKIDLDLRPACWCPICETDVQGVQSWRNPNKRSGRYQQQYDYRCPTCAKICFPYAYPAASAIDWTVPGTRIGDRKRPMADGTIRRIEKGLWKYGLKQMQVPVERNNDTSKDQPRPVVWPMPTQTARHTLGLASTPWLTQAAGNTFEREASTCRSRSVDQPLRTIPGTVQDALLQLPWLDKLYGTASGADPMEAMPTVTATGNHLGLVDWPDGWVDPSQSYVVAGYNPGWTRRATEDVLGSHTTKDHHGLLQVPLSMLAPAGGTWRDGLSPAGLPMPTRTTRETDGLLGLPFLVPYNRTASLRPVGMPMNTLTTVDRDALVAAGVNVDVMDCLFRMLLTREIQTGMAFPADYRWADAGNRDQVRLLGNAVTPPVPLELVRRVYAAYAAA